MSTDAIADSRPSDAMRCIARRLAEAIDHAVERGMLRQARRLADNAVRLAIHSTRLADRIARLRLSQDDPEGAMSIIDACATQSGSMRLLRIACLLKLGRLADAHMQLNEWSGQSTAPLAARRALALIESVHGDRAAASAAVLRNLKHVEDPASLEIFTVLAGAEQEGDRARTWAERLRRACIVSRATVDVDVLCESLGMQFNGANAVIEPTVIQVQTLAMELTASPESLQELVVHQEHTFQPQVAELIRRATEQALDELEEASIGCEALARLSRLFGNHDAALSWAERGLQSNPMSASLTLLLNELRGEAKQHANEPQRKAA